MIIPVLYCSQRKGKIPERNGDCMKWTPTASLRLTTILNWVALGVVTFLMFFIPVMAKWYDDVSLAPPIFLPLCICLCTCPPDWG